MYELFSASVQNTKGLPAEKKKAQLNYTHYIIVSTTVLREILLRTGLVKTVRATISAIKTRSKVQARRVMETPKARARNGQLKNLGTTTFDSTLTKRVFFFFVAMV